MAKQKTPHERLLAFRLSLKNEDGSPVSQSELARRLGCHASFVNQLEAGVKWCGLDTAIVLEELSKDWAGGPIKASEWRRKRSRAA